MSGFKKGSRLGGQTSTDHFWAKVEKTEACWLWVGSRGTNGYGHFSVDGSTIYAHHFLAGVPLKGFVADHLCRVHNCVNPGHIEIVTQMENVWRGKGNATKTHCPQGHSYDEANTYRWPRTGKRACRECVRIRQRVSTRVER